MTGSARWAIGLVALLNLIVFAGPILISTDVFSYIAYARMGVVHGLNPYMHGPVAIVDDPVFRYVGHDWLHVATAYGPLYTLITYPLGAARRGRRAVGDEARGAARAPRPRSCSSGAARAVRGLDPVFALLAVGANPLYVIYGLGGAHNDLIMLALMMARRRAHASSDRDAAAGAAAVVAGALVKATRRGAAAVHDPRAGGARGRSSARWRRSPWRALVGYAVFGIHGIDVVAALNRDAAFVSTDSFATELAHLFGKPGVFPVDHDLLKAALVLIVAAPAVAHLARL